MDGVRRGQMGLPSSARGRDKDFSYRFEFSHSHPPNRARKTGCHGTTCKACRMWEVGLRGNEFGVWLYLLLGIECICAHRDGRSGVSRRARRHRGMRGREGVYKIAKPQAAGGAESWRWKAGGVGYPGCPRMPPEDPGQGPLGHDRAWGVRVIFCGRGSGRSRLSWRNGSRGRCSAG